MARISVLDHGAFGGGIVDDSDAIQEIIDNIATPEDIIVFPQNTTFNMGQIMVPSDRAFEMYGARIEVPRALPHSWGFRTRPQAHNIQFHGGKIVGDPNPFSGYQWQKGIHIDQAVDVNIEGVFCEMHRFDGLSIDGNPGYPSRNIRVIDSVFSSNGRNGVSVTFANNVLFLDCLFSDNNSPLIGAGLDIEPNAEGQVDNVKMVDCIAVRNNIGFYDHSVASVDPGYMRIYQGCEARDNLKYGFVNNRNHRVRYTDCRALGNGTSLANGSGFHFANMTLDLYMIDTTCLNNRNNRGMTFAGVKHVKMFGSMMNGDQIIQIPGIWGAGIQGNSILLGNV